MDKINLLIIITGITLFIALILIFFLLTVKTEHKLSNRLFAIFLTLTTIDISSFLFHNLFEIPLAIAMFSNSATFLQPPVFYLYVLSLCYSDFKLKPKHLLHLLPFLIANLILLPRFYLVDTTAQINFLEHSRSMVEIQFSHLLIHLQIVGYMIAVFLTIIKTRKKYLENYAGGSLESLNWLFQLSLAVSFFYSIALLRNVLKFSDYPVLSEGLKIGLFLLELLIVSWYLFKALNHPDLFRKVDSKIKLVKEIITKETVEAQLEEDTADNKAAIQKLKKYMEQEKPFLNSSLTIQNISDDIGMPVRDLSLLINHTLGQHFFDFVNSYRIENAMMILKDTTKSKVTILEILYEVGFNSKSSFNTAFKKYTKLTPSAYRKGLINRSL